MKSLIFLSLFNLFSKTFINPINEITKAKISEPVEIPILRVIKFDSIYLDHSKKNDNYVNPPVWYKHSYFQGQSGRFGCWTANLHNAGWGDCISSISVSPGWTVVFYEHIGFRGASFTITEDIRNFNDYGLNDAASSVRIYYYGELQNECMIQRKCSQCDGRGWVGCCHGESTKDCPRCNGTGHDGNY